MKPASKRVHFLKKRGATAQPVSSGPAALDKLYRTSVTKTDDGMYITEPQMRLMVINDYVMRLGRYEHAVIPYRVAFPWVKTDGGRMGTTHFSHDGKEWSLAQLPHVTDGVNYYCIQTGSYKFNPDDPLASITDYAVGYIGGGIADFWDPLFHASYRNMFMEAWEECTMEQILDHIEKYGTRVNRAPAWKGRWGT